MSDHTPETSENLPADESAEDAAKRAMAELMADNTALLTNYLRVSAARLQAERKVEELAKEQWAAWRELTSSKKGGFSEAQLKRQSITAPAPTPRRDRGKKRAATKRTTQPAPVETQGNEQHGQPEQTTTQFGN